MAEVADTPSSNEPLPEGRTPVGKGGSPPGRMQSGLKGSPPGRMQPDLKRAAARDANVNGGVNASPNSGRQPKEPRPPRAQQPATARPAFSGSRTGRFDYTGKSWMTILAKSEHRRAMLAPPPLLAYLKEDDEVTEVDLPTATDIAPRNHRYVVRESPVASRRSSAAPDFNVPPSQLSPAGATSSPPASPGEVDAAGTPAPDSFSPSAFLGEFHPVRVNPLAISPSRRPPVAQSRRGSSLALADAPPGFGFPHGSLCVKDVFNQSQLPTKPHTGKEKPHPSTATEGSKSYVTK